MPESVRISLCAIARDEAESLPRCLNSVRDFVDEMVVLDTGSVDDTAAIARDCGAKVFSFDWCDDFSAARNASLKHASGDWILVLDADEVFVPTVAPAIADLIQQDDCLAVTVLRREIGADQAPYSQVSRLFRRQPEITFARAFHETIDDSVLALLDREPHWTVISLDEVAIDHYGYSADAIATRRKSDRARRAMESCLAATPDDAYLCSKLGGSYISSEEYDRAIALLRKGLALSPTEPAITYELHFHLGLAYRQQQQWQLADEHYQQAIAQPVPDIVKLGAYLNWGSLRQIGGDPVGAQQLFERAIAIAPDFAMAHFNLGTALKAQKLWTQAIAAYERAIALNPDYAAAHQNLGVAWMKLGIVPKSLEAFRGAISIYDRQGSKEGDRLRRSLAEMGFKV
ncbi:MAG: tetratricopeptide repeat protein [Cyanobacteria bacterium J06639_1]